MKLLDVKFVGNTLFLPNLQKYNPKFIDITMIMILIDVV